MTNGTLTVHKSDLRSIGHTFYPSDLGCLIVVSDGPAFERILLREILKLWDAVIVSEDDTNNPGEIAYLTSLDWCEYYNASDDDDSPIPFN